MKDDRLYLVHIQECIIRIKNYSKEGHDAFLDDDKTQDAVLRNLQILAESTQKLSESVKTKFPEIDWRALSGFRNVMVHDYLGINLEQIWDIISKDLNELETNITKIIQSLG